MNVQFTNTDSTGAPVTKSLTITLDGEHHTITPNDDAIAEVPDHVGEHLVASPSSVVRAVGDVEADARTAVLEIDADADADDSH